MYESIMANRDYARQPRNNSTTVINRSKIRVSDIRINRNSIRIRVTKTSRIDTKTCRIDTKTCRADTRTRTNANVQSRADPSMPAKFRLRCLQHRFPRLPNHHFSNLAKPHLPDQTPRCESNQ